MPLPHEIGEQIMEGLEHIAPEVGRHVGEHVLKETGHVLDEMGNHNGEFDLGDLAEIAGNVIGTIFSIFE